MQYYGKYKEGRNIHILEFISYEYHVMYKSNGVLFFLLTTNRQLKKQFQMTLYTYILYICMDMCYKLKTGMGIHLNVYEQLSKNKLVGHFGKFL